MVQGGPEGWVRAQTPSVPCRVVQHAFGVWSACAETKYKWSPVFAKGGLRCEQCCPAARI